MSVSVVSVEITTVSRVSGLRSSSVAVELSVVSEQPGVHVSPVTSEGVTLSTPPPGPPSSVSFAVVMNPICLISSTTVMEVDCVHGRESCDEVSLEVQNRHFGQELGSPSSWITLLIIDTFFLSSVFSV